MASKKGLVLRPHGRFRPLEDMGKDDTPAGDKKYWREVGVGFANADGSYNLKLYMSPRLNLHPALSSDYFH